MNYYLDFEFNEHFVKTRTKGTWFKTHEVHTIEPISLGIISEDGRELDIVFNDFDVDAAWYKTDIVKGKKVYWLRDNVLSVIHTKLFQRLAPPVKTYAGHLYNGLKGFKLLLKHFGKTKTEAAEAIKYFCQEEEPDGMFCFNYRSAPEFYAYFADYDWVCFCQCFGTMMKLPTSVGFPMWCHDLKQTLDEQTLKMLLSNPNTFNNFEEALTHIKSMDKYPIQTDEHLAIADARWNKKLHLFLQMCDKFFK